MKKNNNYNGKRKGKSNITPTPIIKANKNNEKNKKLIRKKKKKTRNLQKRFKDE